MKISEMSEQSGLSIDTLRYYEKIGLLPPINRTDGGTREYGENDIKRVDFVKCMRTAGLPVDVLLDYFTLVEQGDETIEARKEILQAHRVRLVENITELQGTLALLDHKIEGYENALLKTEQAFTNV